MKQFIVKNQFEDVTSGELVAVGSIIEADAEREILLRAADVIGKEVQPVAKEPEKKEADSKEAEAAEKVGDEAGADDETAQDKSAAKRVKASKDEK
ncbi:hypothetical protein [Paenibacillus humicus]|uniref:hypothetical protein n=1 Tax=Paenibacillus humicus TaxID=412861 RepID=UPI000FDA6FBD|nr:hypothetical protein [Paenibacillus humicus]